MDFHKSRLRLFFAMPRIFAVFFLAVFFIGIVIFQHMMVAQAIIENAANITPSHIDFDTVFTQERISKDLNIALSDSFIASNQVDGINYSIIQKPTCKSFNSDGSCAEYYPNLCPYLSKLPEPNTGDNGINAPHETQPYPIASGNLSKSADNISDHWNVQLSVPCFEGECSQDYNPAEFGTPLPLELKGQTFNCELWVTVTGIESDSVAKIFDKYLPIKIAKAFEAHVINVAATFSGSQNSPPQNACGSTTSFTDVDGNVYDTVAIGTQCWAKQNLKVIRNPAGVPITRYCYDNNPNICNTDGGLYNWNTTMNTSRDDGSQGICPTGWHIPKDSEWVLLANYLGAHNGTKLMIGGSSGFDVVFSGYRSSVFYFRGTFAAFWSSTEGGYYPWSSESNAWHWDLYPSSDYIVKGNNDKQINLSVRCLKNQQTNSAPIISSLKQYKSDSITEISEGDKIDSGDSISPKVNVVIEAKVSDPDNDKVKIKASLYRITEGLDSTIIIPDGTMPTSTPIPLVDPAPSLSPILFKESNFVNSNESVSIKFENLEEGNYYWEVQAIDEKGNESEIILFGEQSRIKPDFTFNNDFTFVHMTDVHLGSNKVPGHEWYEYQSYPRFTDNLYEIEKMTNKPDFILIGGDNVEYNNITWLKDFKSITEDFTKRTKIEVYVVPGNHDRRTVVILDDFLKNYIEIIKKPKEENASALLNDWIPVARNNIEGVSESGGKNWYNYYFYHNGLQFIGLDSGEDVLELDLKDPESTGISDNVMSLLENLDSNTPKVLFMHNPVLTGKTEEHEAYFGNMDPNDCRMFFNERCFIENSSFINNWQRFVDYSFDHKVQIVLSGHNHEASTFRSSYGVEVETNENDAVRPLFIQTQSATKDNFIDENTEYKHGYRIIDVKRGVAKPREVSETLRSYDKVISKLTVNNNSTLGFKVNDKNVFTMAPEEMSGLSTPYFIAPSSGKVILYDDTERSIYKINNSNFSDAKYDLLLQKRGGDIEVGSLGANGIIPKYSAFKFINNELFGMDSLTDFLVLHKDNVNALNVLDFKGVNISNDADHEIIIDWPIFDIPLNIPNGGYIQGLSFKVNNIQTVYTPLIGVTIIDLNSPGELQVYNNEGKVTGVFNGEIKEEIPYSMYVPETETVYVFSDEGDNIIDNLKTQVVGSYEATYGFSITLEENDQKIGQFIANDIPINKNTIHEFLTDRQTLLQGERGATLKIDKEGDGIFEQTVNVGANFSDAVASVTSVSISGTEGNNGWHISDVQIELSAEDNEGGVGVEKIEYSLDNGQIWNIYGEPFRIMEEGIYTVLYRSQDIFGNIEETRTAEINIDKTSSLITNNIPIDGAEYLLNQNIVADWQVADALSGVESAEGTADSGQAIDTFSVGAKTFNIASSDKAGNQTAKALNYYVRYDYSGDLSPIKSDGSKFFKLGSTIPVKFQLKDNNGNFVSTSNAYIYVNKVSDSVSGLEEVVSAGEANVGNLFRYDIVDNQYIFNLGTKNLSVGTWQLSIKLDDETINKVNLSLKQ